MDFLFLFADDSIKSLCDAKEISKEMKNYFLFHLIYSLERLTLYRNKDNGSENYCTNFYVATSSCSTGYIKHFGTDLFKKYFQYLEGLASL